VGQVGVAGRRSCELVHRTLVFRSCYSIEFKDVFPEDLQKDLPRRDVRPSIELVTRLRPANQADLSNESALSSTNQDKKQVAELTAKGFIQPSNQHLELICLICEEEGWLTTNVYRTIVALNRGLLE